MEFHPVAAIFPLMEGAELSALAADIRAFGQREPIWLHEGKIIDGRNRFRACQQERILPKTRDWDGDGSLVQFVLSQNLHRRHLNASQRALVAQNALPFLEAEARGRQHTSGPGVYGGKPLSTDLAEAVGRSIDHAADLTGASATMVNYARRLTREAPEVIPEIQAGNKSLATAYSEHVEANRNGSNPKRWSCPVCHGRGYVTTEPRTVGVGR